MNIVIAEQRDGKLNRASWEAIVAAQQMGGPIKVLLPGKGVATAAAELATADVSEVVSLEHDALSVYTADGYAQALSAALTAESATHVIFAHTYEARDFAPKLAARLD